MDEVAENDIVRITVDYGYDIHWIEMFLDTWERIKSGESVDIEGQGFFCEGEIEQDLWEINSSGQGSLYISTDALRDVYSGNIDDGEVSIQFYKRKQGILSLGTTVKTESLHDNPDFDPDIINYEDDPAQKAYEKWYEENHTYRIHVWKIRREGYRELLLSKGWRMRGAYAIKSIAGQEVIISGRGGDNPDCLFVRFCLKFAVKRPNFVE